MAEGVVTTIGEVGGDDCADVGILDDLSVVDRREGVGVAVMMVVVVVWRQGSRVGRDARWWGRGRFVTLPLSLLRLLSIRDRYKTDVFGGLDRNPRHRDEYLSNLSVRTFACLFVVCLMFLGHLPDASDTAAKAAAAGVPDVGDTDSSGGGQAIGIALGLGAACCGGVYILNAKAARNK